MINKMADPVLKDALIGAAVERLRGDKHHLSIHPDPAVVEDAVSHGRLVHPSIEHMGAVEVTDVAREHSPEFQAHVQRLLSGGNTREVVTSSGIPYNHHKAERNRRVAKAVEFFSRVAQRPTTPK